MEDVSEKPEYVDTCRDTLATSSHILREICCYGKSATPENLSVHYSGAMIKRPWIVPSCEHFGLIAISYVTAVFLL
jgi:hypothetical protein